MGRYILGAGATGLAAGSILGWKIFEAEEGPGGICSSYYLTTGLTSRRPTRAPDEEDYRFELGGGHWMFGEEADALRVISQHSDLRLYERKSSVYLPARDLFVPYPIQNHLSYLPPQLADRALDQLLAGSEGPQTSMSDWLRRTFGSVLCDLFFAPFHRSYTAGLWEDISPQDFHKSPYDRAMIEKGRHGKIDSAGYNVRFSYPVGGLGSLFRSVAQDCDVSYMKRVTAIDPVKRILKFADGTDVRYELLISTIPLNRTVEMAGLNIPERPDPYTSVVVVNIGGTRGKKCPDDHWLYVPESRSGFFRIGFYSNVERSFLPASRRSDARCISMYVEWALRGGEKPSDREVARFCTNVVGELREWNFLDEVDIVDPTWIDVAYTWSHCGSTWRERAISALRDIDIHQAGRYGRWQFQGIVDSFSEGLNLGQMFGHDKAAPYRLSPSGLE